MIFFAQATGAPNTWEDFLDVRVEYQASGIADEYDYANILGSPKLKQYIRSIYDRYKTNGYPETAASGPTDRVVWNLSIRN